MAKLIVIQASACTARTTQSVTQVEIQFRAKSELRKCR